MIELVIIGALGLLSLVLSFALGRATGRRHEPPPQAPNPTQKENRRRQLPPELLDQAARPQTHALEEIEQEARDALQDHLDAGPHDDIGARLDRAFADEDL